MKKCSWISFALAGWLVVCCQAPNERVSIREGASQNYVQILEGIEKAGNQYRQAIDLLKYADSSVERSLGESHLEATRQFLEIQFQLAELDSKNAALKDSKPASIQETSKTSPEDLHYEKLVEEVWRLSATLDEAKSRFQKAREKLERAKTPEAFRSAQLAIDLAQKEVTIADKKLDLAGSDLDIEDYQRKKNASKGVISFSLADRMKVLRDEFLGSSGKGYAGSVPPEKSGGASSSDLLTDRRHRGLLSAFQDYLEQSRIVRVLRRTLRINQQTGLGVQSALNGRLGELEGLQQEHVRLNQKTTAAYDQAYSLLKNGGVKEEVKGLLAAAELQMTESTRLDERKELVKRIISQLRNQGFLVEEDHEKIADWVSIASNDQNESFYRFSSRAGIVLGLVALVLVISIYLKKLPYRFMQEGKNAFYFRKLISVCTALIIAGILLMNVVSDFGSVTAVIGLAGAGLAIALQDPIVSLAGWFLIVGKYGISVGDRIEINQVKGDVLDIGLLRLAILEVGNWVGAEQSTGRVVFFPNSFILKHHYYNYSTGNSYIWDEIKITLTYDSDWMNAKKRIEEIALNVSREFIEEAQEKSDEIAKRFHINLGTITPIVYVSIGERGVDLLLRYLTAIRKRRMTNDQISREILSALEADPTFVLAPPARPAASDAKNISEKSPLGSELGNPPKTMT
ncbi:MAG: mechanosensitive ion channel family protein [Terriglobia bacterium]